MKVCHHCGREVKLLTALQRTDSCATCLSDLKCCLNCRFFDPAASHECREPQADWVTEKTRANFCEFFEFRETTRLSEKGSQESAQSARDAFFNLFGKK
jgi:hypothetical protein